MNETYEQKCERERIIAAAKKTYQAILDVAEYDRKKQEMLRKEKDSNERKEMEYDK